MRWINTLDLEVCPEVKRVVFRQVGWMGQSGAFYPTGVSELVLKESEPGSFSPIYIELGD